MPITPQLMLPPNAANAMLVGARQTSIPHAAITRSVTRLTQCVVKLQIIEAQRICVAKRASSTVQAILSNWEAVLWCARIVIGWRRWAASPTGRAVLKCISGSDEVVEWLDSLRRRTSWPPLRLQPSHVSRLACCSTTLGP